MINQKVIDGLVWLYSIFDIKLLTVIATGFTIYFGYQKVTKKICVSYSISGSKLYDRHVTNLVISNKRDNSIVISSIYLCIVGKGSIELVKFDEPLVLKGYDAKLIDVPKYSEIRDINGPVSIDIFGNIFFSVVTMSGDMIKCDIESPLTIKNLDGRLYKMTSNFNDIVLTNRMGFIFTYSVKGKVRDVIIDKHGFISGSTPFRYNMFNDISKESFRDFLIMDGYHDFYDDYALFKVLDNLQTELVISKATVSAKIEKEI
ncbi:TPA: hypothetical protein U2L56_000946 [Citrobacter koseri]|uniref:hypothetical protein n=1 Tax=Citrobacter sp. CK196 TaxID=2985105 RepID=UPI00257644BD|nr:hypothetical protein [Citrobacter sp. CK196]MDM2986855.1 hypothetical protein [Citrobacter sp. CK196]HEM7934059.1 hypothetical protein [Citrobacter koseri]